MYDYVILSAVMVVSVIIFLYLAKLFLSKMDLSYGKFLYLLVIIPMLAVLFCVMLEKEYEEFMIITGRKARLITQNSNTSPLVVPQRSMIRIPLWGGISINL